MTPGHRQEEEPEEDGRARRHPRHGPDVPHTAVTQIPVVALGADTGVLVALPVPCAHAGGQTGVQALLASV